MSQELIERILATYKSVEGKPGWVWFNDYSICRLEDLREIYEKNFRKGPCEKDQQ